MAEKSLKDIVAKLSEEGQEAQRKADKAKEDAQRAKSAAEQRKRTRETNTGAIYDNALSELKIAFDGFRAAKLSARLTDIRKQGAEKADRFRDNEKQYLWAVVLSVDFQTEHGAIQWKVGFAHEIHREENQHRLRNESTLTLEDKVLAFITKNKGETPVVKCGELDPADGVPETWVPALVAEMLGKVRVYAH